MCTTDSIYCVLQLPQQPEYLVQLPSSQSSWYRYHSSQSSWYCCHSSQNTWCSCHSCQNTWYRCHRNQSTWCCCQAIVVPEIENNIWLNYLPGQKGHSAVAPALAPFPQWLCLWHSDIKTPPSNKYFLLRPDTVQPTMFTTVETLINHGRHFEEPSGRLGAYWSLLFFYWVMGENGFYGLFFKFLRNFWVKKEIAPIDALAHVPMCSCPG